MPLVTAVSTNRSGEVRRVSAATAGLAQELAEIAAGLRSAWVAAHLAALCPAVDEMARQFPLSGGFAAPATGAAVPSTIAVSGGDNGLEPHEPFLR
jgi:hypothetical protein